MWSAARSRSLIWTNWIFRTSDWRYGGQFILQSWSEFSKLCKDNINIIINITSTALKHYKQTNINNLLVWSSIQYLLWERSGLNCWGGYGNILPFLWGFRLFGVGKDKDFSPPPQQYRTRQLHCLAEFCWGSREIGNCQQVRFFSWFTEGQGGLGEIQLMSSLSPIIPTKSRTTPQLWSCPAQ